jgi:hypothetical protein
MFNRKIYLYIAAMLCILPGTAQAGGRDRIALPETRPLSWECVVDAAAQYNLPLAAMVGILATEGGKTGEALSNTNGTWDMGPFQINTCHVNELLQAGMAPEVILQDGCANAYAAAFILRKEYERTRNIWDAVGAYHSRTPHFRDAYLGRVRKHLIKLSHTGLAGLLPQNSSPRGAGR